MYSTLEDFIKALRILDKKIVDYGIKELDIKAFGGFSMLYHGLRDTGTRDIDALNDRFSEELLQAIWETAKECGLSNDWLNNQWFSWNGYDMSLFDWTLFEVSTTKFEKIRLHVATIDTVLMFKVRGLETREKDLDDVVRILNTYGVNTIDELNRRCELDWIRQYETAYKRICIGLE